MHLKDRYSWIKHIDFILIDLISLIFSFYIAYYLKFGYFNFFEYYEWKILFILICAINLIITSYSNVYSGVLKRRYYEQVIIGIPLYIYQAATICILFYALKIGAVFSREMLFTTYFLYFLISTVFKYINKIILIKYNKYYAKKTRLLLVVDKKSAKDVINNIKIGDMINYEIKYVYLVDGEATQIQNVPVITSYENRNIEEVIVATSLSKVPGEMIKFFINNGIIIRINIDEITGFESEVSSFQKSGNYTKLNLDVFDINDNNRIGYYLLKRLLDILAGFVGLIIMIPLTIGIYIANKICKDNGPVFFKQERIGRNGQKFKMLKFRSMLVGADEILKDYLRENEEARKEYKIYKKLENDPRVTKVGEFLRRTSLDEVPQLLHLLSGKMTLIGPRPYLEREKEDIGPYYNIIIKYKPGITGLWQVSGRSDATFEERLSFDLKYHQNCSLLLDLEILVKTFMAVLKKKGAK